ncbi:Putative ribonuclease H protein At1g65750, partial [Linum perenne]
PVWRLEPNGKYSVKSGYLLATNRVDEEGDAIWAKFWKWQGSQRVRQFLWVAVQNRLLTNAERHRHRHLTGNSNCGLCAGVPETCEHILRHCPLAKQVWGTKLGINPMDPFFTMSMENWWKTNIDNSSNGVSFGAVCWMLWKRRNERIFKGKRASAYSIIERSKFWEKSTKLAYEGHEQLKLDRTKQQRSASICWRASPCSEATLNTGGSVIRQTGVATTGGVLRDHNGRVSDAFTANLGKCSITRAELTGIVLGMERAWNKGIRSLEIQTDSLCAVNLLLKADNLDHQHATIVGRFRKLLERNWSVNVIHVYREANCPADALVNKGHGMSLGTHTVDGSDGTIRYWERYDLVAGGGGGGGGGRRPV